MPFLPTSYAEECPLRSFDAAGLLSVPAWRDTDKKGPSRITSRSAVWRPNMSGANGASVNSDWFTESTAGGGTPSAAMQDKQIAYTFSGNANETVLHHFCNGDGGKLKLKNFFVSLKVRQPSADQSVDNGDRGWIWGRNAPDTFQGTAFFNAARPNDGVDFNGWRRRSEGASSTWPDFYIADRTAGTFDYHEPDYYMGASADTLLGVERLFLCWQEKLYGLIRRTHVQYPLPDQADDKPFVFHACTQAVLRGTIGTASSDNSNNIGETRTFDIEVWDLDRVVQQRTRARVYSFPSAVASTPGVQIFITK